jgi:hypothetical protein
VEAGGVVVGVRAERGVDDRVRSRDELELRVSPAGAFASLVLAIADERRLLPERLSRRRGVEVELDHLPVALVLVVEVVEDVEEPVLQCELARVRGIGDDPRVGGGRLALVEPVRPLVVDAAGGDGIAREVEVVVEEAVAEVLAGRRDLDDVRPVPGPPEGDVGAAEHEVHVRRYERLALVARLLLLDEPNDRRVPLGEGERWVGRLRRGRRREAGGDRRDGCAPPHLRPPRSASPPPGTTPC